MLLGALEGGGTKMICAIGEEDGKVLDRVSIPTLSPDETMPAIIDYFRTKGVCALGIGFFGPLDLNPASKQYGHVMATNKTEWQFYDVFGVLKNELNIPCKLDTDVNAAALGEATYGSMRRLKNGVYYTVGTGIGVGVLSNGSLVHGLLHPEGGHVPVRRHPDDSFEGCCSFHIDCLEGLASGPAIEKRTGVKGAELPQDHQVWKFVSYYLAQAICGSIYMLSPEKVVLGGGVLNRAHLFPMIREDVKRLLNGYIKAERLDNIDSYIVPSALGGDQAVMGCLKLAYEAALLS